MNFKLFKDFGRACGRNLKEQPVKVMTCKAEWSKTMGHFMRQSSNLIDLT